MKERLVDVMNEKNTVLHVFPVTAESPEACEQEALKAAAVEQLVPEADLADLHTRMHISRGGQLMPVGDPLEVRREQTQRLEQRIRDRAYFLWQEGTGVGHRADEDWHRARELERTSLDG